VNRYRYDELSHSPYPVFASMYSLHLDVRWGSWIEYFTDDGVPYYYNSDTQETAWEIPAEALQAPVAKKGPPALPPRTYLNSSGTHGATGKTPTAAVIPAVGLPSVEDDDGLTSNPLFGDSTNTHLFAASNAGLHDSHLSPHEREHKYSVEHSGDTGMTSVRVPRLCHINQPMYRVIGSPPRCPYGASNRISSFLPPTYAIRCLVSVVSTCSRSRPRLRCPRG